jgi:hypothetical protein
MMTDFRWWLFKQLSSLGWAICPDPYRSVLKTVYRLDVEIMKWALTGPEHDPHKEPLGEASTLRRPRNG